MKNALLVVPLLSAGLLAAGCAAQSSTSAGTSGTGTVSSSSPAAGASSAAASSGSTGAGATSSATSSSGSGSGTVAGGAPACTSAQLTANLGGGAGAGMSQYHTGLQLRNTGSTTCTLYGYPGVSWVRGDQGLQTGAAAVRQPDPSGTEQVVTLAPGALASAPLDIVDAAVIPPSECKPVAVRGLRIYPPGQTTALFLPDATPPNGYGECSLPTKSPTLLIGYVEAGVQPN